MTVTQQEGYYWWLGDEAPIINLGQMWQDPECTYPTIYEHSWTNFTTDFEYLPLNEDGSQDITFFSKDRVDIVKHEVQMTFSLYDFPVDMYPMVYHYSTFKFEVLDPCWISSIEPLEDQLIFNYVFWSEFHNNDFQILYSFLEFNDTKSVEWDKLRSGDESVVQGQTWCEERAYFINVPYLKNDTSGVTIVNDETGGIYWWDSEEFERHLFFSERNETLYRNVTIEFGEDGFNHLAGTYKVDLIAALKLFPNVTAANPAVINLFRLDSDLSFDDQFYYIAEEKITVDIPVLEFTPKLPANEMITIEILAGKDGKEPKNLDKEILDFDLEAMTLTIFVEEDNSYSGEWNVTVTYYLKPNLEGHIFTSSFLLTVYPAAIAGEVPKPKFGSGETSGKAEVGAAWQAMVPQGTHELQLEMTLAIDTGAASFVIADNGSGTLKIDAGTTTEANIGTYPISAVLTDSAGEKSDTWKYTLEIVGKKVEETKKEEPVVQTIKIDNSNFVFKPPPPAVAKPTVEIAGMTETGLIEMKFGNRMVAQKQLLNDILAEYAPPSDYGKTDAAGDDGEADVEGGEDEDEGGEEECDPEMDEECEEDEESDEEAENRRRRRLVRQLKAQGVFSVKVIAGDESDPEKLGNYLQLLEFNEEKLQIQVLFKDPLFISSNQVADEIEITFNSGDLFRDEYGQKLAEGFVVRRKIPAQVPSAAEAAALGSAKDALGNGALVASTINFFVNIAMSGAMQYLWALIESQQLIIMLPLFKTQIPANSGIIFGAIMTIAACDAIPTDPIYEYFELDGKDPINENFETVGFETILIMHNLGSFALILAGTPFYYMYYCILRGLDVNEKREKKLKAMANNLFYGFLIRLITTTYLISIVCCFINLTQLDWSDDWNSFNSNLSIVFAVVYLSYPFLSSYFLYKNWYRIKQGGFETAFGEMWAGFKIDSKGTIVYLLIDYLRKICLGIAVAVFTNQLVFQTMLLVYSSMAIIIAAGHIDIKHDKKEIRHIIINEAFLGAQMYICLCFTPFVPDPVTRYQIGYAQILVLVVGLAFNMKELVYQMIDQIKTSIRTRMHKRQARQYIEKVLNTKDGGRQISGKALIQRRYRAIRRQRREDRQVLLDTVDSVIKAGRVRRAMRHGDWKSCSQSEIARFKPRRPDSKEHLRRQITSSEKAYGSTWEIPETVGPRVNENAIKVRRPSIWTVLQKEEEKKSEIQMQDLSAGAVATEGLKNNANIGNKRLEPIQEADENENIGFDVEESQYRTKLEDKSRTYTELDNSRDVFVSGGKLGGLDVTAEENDLRVESEVSESNVSRNQVINLAAGREFQSVNSKEKEAQVYKRKRYEDLDLPTPQNPILLTVRSFLSSDSESEQEDPGKVGAKIKMSVKDFKILDKKFHIKPQDFNKLPPKYRKFELIATDDEDEHISTDPSMRDSDEEEKGETDTQREETPKPKPQAFTFRKPEISTIIVVEDPYENLQAECRRSFYSAARLKVEDILNKRPPDSDTSSKMPEILEPDEVLEDDEVNESGEILSFASKKNTGNLKYLDINKQEDIYRSKSMAIGLPDGQVHFQSDGGLTPHEPKSHHFTSFDYVERGEPSLLPGDEQVNHAEFVKPGQPSLALVDEQVDHGEQSLGPGEEQVDHAELDEKHQDL